MTKAWIVQCADEWCTLMHADTRGRAKELARRYVDDWNEFTDMGARRLPELDDRPFTYEDCKNAGFEYAEFEDPDDGSQAKEAFTNDCPCDICKSIRMVVK